MKRIVRSDYQHGLSLLELMIAAALGVLLSIATIHIYSGSKVTYGAATAIARLQENTRVASLILDRELRMADFWGCASRVADIVNHIPPVSVSSCAATQRDLNFDQPLSGIEDTASDCITVHHADPQQSFPLIADPADPASMLEIATGNGLAKGDYLAIADCRNVDLFRIDPGSGPDPDLTGQIVHNITLSKRYDMSSAGGASVYPVTTVRFFIQNDPDNNNEPTLYRNIDGSNEALVTGVEHLRARYGEDNNGDNAVDSYLSASGVSDMSAVISLQIALLFRSDDNVRTEVSDTVYDLLGRSVDPADDSRYRSLVINDLSLRNRLP